MGEWKPSPFPWEMVVDPEDPPMIVDAKGNTVVEFVENPSDGAVIAAGYELIRAAESVITFGVVLRSAMGMMSAQLNHMEDRARAALEKIDPENSLLYRGEKDGQDTET